jgi:hypothetical protein
MKVSLFFRLKYKWIVLFFIFDVGNFCSGIELRKELGINMVDPISMMIENDLKLIRSILESQSKSILLSDFSLFERLVNSLTAICVSTQQQSKFASLSGEKVLFHHSHFKIQQRTLPSVIATY